MRFPGLLLTIPLAAACGAAPLPDPVPPPLPPPVLRPPDWSAPAPPPEAIEPHTLEIRLAPVLSAAREVERVDVALRFSEPPGEFGEPGPLILDVAATEGGDKGWPVLIHDAEARDAEGPLTLRAGDTGTWRSDRRPVGVVRVSYRVAVMHAEQGRFHGTRAYGGGFQGTGSTLLLLPDRADTYKTRIVWDLAGAGEGAVAASSLGIEARLSIPALREAVFMAGPLGRMAVEDRSAHVEAAWLGAGHVDVMEAVPWAFKARAAEQGIVHDKELAPFLFFQRAVPGLGKAVSAAPRAGGLLVLAGEDQTGDRAYRFAVAEALAKRWIGGEIRLSGARWFDEGFSAHLAREALLRAGLCTPEESLDDLRERLDRYNGTPDDAGRGLLYAADLDAALRAKSKGARSLDDLLVALLEKARSKPGEPLPAGALRDLVGAELGPEGQARYDAAVVKGEPFTPPSEAFGPCFKREKKALVWVRDPRVPGPSCTRHTGK